MNHGWETKVDGWEECDDKYSLRAVVNQKYTYKNNPDVILIMAGGLDDNGDIHEWVKRRLDAAIIYYNKYPNDTTLIPLGGGTYHKPPYKNKEGYVIHESTACANYLVFNGVDPKHVYKEWSAYDTIASVYFALTNHIGPGNFQRVLVITSEFHMERTKLLFEWIFSLGGGDHNLEFYSASDEGIDRDIISSRIKREKSSVRNIRENLIPKIKTMRQFHNWLYTDHKAYSCNLDEREEISEEVKKSY